MGYEIMIFLGVMCSMVLGILVILLFVININGNVNRIKQRLPNGKKKGAHYFD